MCPKTSGSRWKDLEDLKALDNLPKDFPRTMPDSRQWQSCNGREEGEVYNSIRGDQWCEQIYLKEERERPRGVPLYLEEHFKHVEEKKANFDPFFMVIQGVLDKYIDLF